jgi:putative aldouronate transport system substrate-binding protein
MKKKRLVAIGICLISAFCFVLTGCKTQKQVNSESVSEGETYSLYIGDSWMSTLFDANTKDTVLKELEKQTGITIDLELAKSDDVSSEINVLLASGDLPDMIFTGGDTRTRMINDGYVIKLNDYLEDAPNILKNLGFVLPEWREKDGSIYGVGSFVWNDPRYALNLSVNTVQIRYDMLKDMGYEKLDRTNEYDSFITVDEYLELLDQVKEKYPDVYPALFDTEKAIEVLIKANGTQFVNFYGGTYTSYEEDHATSVFSSKYLPPTIEFLNEFYLKGYAPQGMTSFTQEENEALLSNGKVFSTLGSVDGLDSANAALSEVNDESRFVYFYLIASEDVKDILINGYAMTEGPNLMITKNCKNPEKLIKFFDFCASPEGSTIIGAGVEGITYTKNEDGTLTPMDEVATGYAMWDTKMIKKFGIGNWLNLLPAMEGIDENGQAYDINAQAAFAENKWVMYNNVDWKHFAYPRSINANIKINSEDQPEAYDALSKINAYAFDRIAKAISSNSSEKCEAEWIKCQKQMKADGLDSLNEAVNENWSALAEAYGKELDKVFTTVLQ